MLRVSYTYHTENVASLMIRPGYHNFEYVEEMIEVLRKHSESIGHSAIPLNSITATFLSVANNYIIECERQEAKSGVVDWRSFRNVPGVDFTARLKLPKEHKIVNTEEPFHGMCTSITADICHVDKLIELGIPFVEYRVIDKLLVIASAATAAKQMDNFAWLKLIASGEKSHLVSSRNHPMVSVIHPLLHQTAEPNSGVVIQMHNATIDLIW